MNIQFGKHTQTTVLEDGVSIKTVETPYKDSVVTGNVREFYEIRNRVNNELEIAASFMKFHKEFTTDPTMLDPTFRVEGLNRPDGKIFTVNCYKRIVR